MGGDGSGIRWGRSPKRKAECLIAFGIKDLGSLAYNHAYRFVHCTYNNGQAVSVYGNRHQVAFLYRPSDHDEADPLVEQEVKLTWTPCHYGGERPWFVCPGCGRRAAKLYYRSRFSCRQCLNLTYYSRTLTGWERNRRQTSKLERRIVFDQSESMYYRPKGMHWRTFHRIVDRIQYYERREAVYSARVFGRLLQSIAHHSKP